MLRAQGVDARLSRSVDLCDRLPLAELRRIVLVGRSWVVQVISSGFGTDGSPSACWADPRVVNRTWPCLLGGACPASSCDVEPLLGLAACLSICWVIVATRRLRSMSRMAPSTMRSRRT